MLARSPNPPAAANAETSRNWPARTPIIPLSRFIDDIVDDSVFLGLLRIHDEVALHVLLYLIELLASVLGE
jgi:hypothetical protein